MYLYIMTVLWSSWQSYDHHDSLMIIKQFNWYKEDLLQQKYFTENMP